MVIFNGVVDYPHHRQNRRRERPGSRTRRSISRRSAMQYEYDEGIADACDPGLPLPSDKTRPSPLLRQSFDQSWQRWKVREAEQRALAEMDRLQREQEQRRLFGGEIDELDEHYHLGSFWNSQNPDVNTNLVAYDIPVKQFSSFVIRPGKPKKRQIRKRILPLPLSLFDLGQDSIHIHPHTKSIQHRPSDCFVKSTSLSSSPLRISRTGTPQSLPPEAPGGEWTFIENHIRSRSTSPASEPETWILIDDSKQIHTQ